MTRHRKRIGCYGENNLAGGIMQNRTAAKSRLADIGDERSKGPERAQIDSSRTKIERLLYVRLLQRTFLSNLRGRILEEHFLLDVFGKA